MPTPFSQALCSSSAWSRFQRRVWWSMWRCSNQRARSTPGTALSENHCAHERWWSQTRASGSVDSPSSAIPGRTAVERRPEARLGFLHRVEEDAVGSEVAHELRDRDVVRDRLAARPDVPGVVVDEDAQAARLQLVDQLADPRHVAVEVELVPLVDPDHGVGVPEDDAVEAAELALRLGAEALRREASRLVVVEQLVPQPDQRDREAAARPGELGRAVGAVVVLDPRRRPRRASA